MELPPRTRRILETWMDQLGKSGTTSAHAENTGYMLPEQNRAMNYLRARGEYVFRTRRSPKFRELPPRTRRIHTRSLKGIKNAGTTSAHAENTWGGGVGGRKFGNYLRARGEYKGKSCLLNPKSELPPRTRRIRYRYGLGCPYGGTTSAHAENT